MVPVDTILLPLLLLRFSFSLSPCSDADISNGLQRRRILLCPFGELRRPHETFCGAPAKQFPQFQIALAKCRADAFQLKSAGFGCGWPESVRCAQQGSDIALAGSFCCAAVVQHSPRQVVGGVYRSPMLLRHHAIVQRCQCPSSRRAAGPVFPGCTTIMSFAPHQTPLQGFYTKHGIIPQGISQFFAVAITRRIKDLVLLRKGVIRRIGSNDDFPRPRVLLAASRCFFVF
mmetsp:Transcript_6683/g.18694  ORF Transcript_6683/g.18694 Transcript_6683/m.18694 type:complete len:230 (-) Transcript_6683:1207-1896(-)